MTPGRGPGTTNHRGRGDDPQRHLDPTRLMPAARCPHPRFIPGYTLCMKTAISVPDDTFEQATRRAAALGMSRSEFFTRAVRRYLEQLDAESLTQQVNAAVALIRDDDSADAAVAAGRGRVTRDEDGW